MCGRVEGRLEGAWFYRVRVLEDPVCGTFLFYLTPFSGCETVSSPRVVDYLEEVLTIFWARVVVHSQSSILVSQ